ncbi:MAG: alpha/beta hydrolase [Proteobacteria bacterium]|nr:alpha/beta hydrolase [Pseudomonadota bacterium]
MNGNSTAEPARDLIDHSHRPSKLLLLLEGRAVYDAASMLPMLAMKRFLPQGDNHPVLVLPGFLASSKSTSPLRKYLADLGYRSHRWKLGYNMGYSHGLHDGMRDRVIELVERYGEKISLVGWSLGGVYARELAREMPDIVRQVITMGSPFRGHPSSSNVHKIFNMISDLPYEKIPNDFLQHMAVPPPMPTTALYTRGDGVVAWQSTVELSDRLDVENIHVGGSHLGLGFNPRVLVALADRLAQPEGNWQPFKPSVWMKPVFKNWYPDWLVHGKENPLKV